MTGGILPPPSAGQVSLNLRSDLLKLMEHLGTWERHLTNNVT